MLKNCCIYTQASILKFFHSESQSNLLGLWFRQLKSHILDVKPQFIAIHCQEVGGKNYISSMKNVSNFTQLVSSLEILSTFKRHLLV